MPELEKILPLVLIALWYIFRGGRKKNKRQAPQQFEQDAQEQAQPTNKPPSSKPTSLQDILEELMGEEKAKKPAPPYQQPAPKAESLERERTYATEADTLETLDPIYENYDDSEKAKETRDFLKDYDAAQKERAGEAVDFDLRQAIIYQAILERPYKD